MSNQTPTIPSRIYEKFFQLVICATSKQVREWVAGSAERHERTERVLRRLVMRKKLKSVKTGVTNIYYAPKYKEIGNIEHGLGTTEGLVRFWRSDQTGEIIPSRHFRGMGSVPEWGMKFGDTLLLYEFCTKDNYYARLRKKLDAYNKNLPKIEEKYGKGFVVFVCDVHGDYVKNFDPKPDWAVFTDYETFKSVPIGNQLTASIYFWKDVGEVPLRHESST